MDKLTTLAQMQEYRQRMLDGLARHGWLSYFWEEGSGHEQVAEQLLAEGLIEEIHKMSGFRTFQLRAREAIRGHCLPR